MMTANGAARCQGEGCTHRAVIGASYCTEEHYDELVEERKAKYHYRSAAPVPVDDYTKALKPPRESCVHVPEPGPSDDDLRLLRNGGFSYKEIGKRYGVKWTRIATRCQRLGLGGERAHAPHKEKLMEVAQSFEAASPLKEPMTDTAGLKPVCPRCASENIYKAGLGGPNACSNCAYVFSGFAEAKPIAAEPPMTIADEPQPPQFVWKPAISAAPGMNHFDMVIEDLLNQIHELQMTVDLLKKHKARA